MNITWKKTGIALLIIILLIIFFSFLINTLYYCDVLSNNTVRYFKMIYLILSFFIGGIYMGLNSPNKGYLYGLRLSLIYIVISLFLSIIFNKISFSKIIYYIILTSCITFGSMIGINKKHQ